MGGYVAIISTKSMIYGFKNEPKKKLIYKLPLLYTFILLKRYVRLIPMIFVTNFWMYGIQKYILPNTYNRIANVGNCAVLDSNSWNLFDIWGYNLNICSMWFWYLSIDYQCFIMIPLILMCFMYNKYAGYFVCIGMIIASIVYTFW